MNDVLNSLKPKYRKIDLDITLNGNSSLQVQHSPGYFAQLTTNLVLNAVIHAFENCTQGSITITISERDNEVLFIFSDNGHGIEQNVIGNIFEPFYTTKRGLGGSGLGLHIVYSIVTQKLLGQIDVTSKVGKGTEFTICFPRKISLN